MNLIVYFNIIIMCTRPDFYPSKEECLKSENTRINSNPRYKFFTQTHFTAGDVEQFHTHRDPTNGILKNQKIDLENNVFNSVLAIEFWEKYKDLDPLSVTNTFNYIFHKFKKGIFIKIKNGERSTFLPFSKKDFTNEWSKQINTINLTDFLKKIQLAEGRKFHPNMVNKFTDCWYANNCLVRWEYPINEGDTNNCAISDMFLTLSKERKVPDLEFFVNKRDFPIIKKDGTEAYDHLFGDNTKLRSHSYNNYSPILSMVKCENYADIPIPTGEDWARVSRKENKFFPKTATRTYILSKIPWNKKKPIAIFRGSSTGSGVTVETNPRLKLAHLSVITPPDSDGLPLLDAGITEWNLRPRKIKGEKCLKTINTKNFPFSLSNKLDPNQQLAYKYIINVDGHVCAFRLGLELEYGSCILLAESKYKLWFTDMLKPYIHYIPVKADLSDLLEKIRWCKANDSKCQEIADNAYLFSQTYLTKNGILDYLQKLLCDLKKTTGIYVYNNISISSVLKQKELEYINSIQRPYTKKDLSSLTSFPSYKRSYGFLEGIERVFRLVYDYSSVKNRKVVFTNNSTTVSRYKYEGVVEIAEKKSSRDLTHEFFVAKFCTNELLRQIPNFCYAYLYGGDFILVESLSKNTLNDFIHSKEFTMKKFIHILIQICLALHMAQKRFKFVHNDLTPWNIILQKTETETTFDYIIDSKTVYRIKTNVVPIIIDMERSHVVYENCHYGEVNLFSCSTIQDIVTLLVTVCFEISKLSLSVEATSQLLTLASFISGSGYRRAPFHTVGELRYFLGKAKKYSELLYSNKYELESKTPLDFVKYLERNFEVSIQVSDTLFYHMDHDNARQVSDFALSSTVREKALTYANVLHQMRKFEQSPSEHPIVLYHTAQTIFENAESIFDSMLSYLEENKIGDSDKFVRKFNSTMKSLASKFDKRIAHAVHEHTVHEDTPQGREDNASAPEKIVFDESTFLFPRAILEIIKKNKSPSENPTPITDIIERTLLRKKSLYPVPEGLAEECEELSSIESDTYSADITTIRLLAKHIYSDNLEKLDCKYNSVYKIILNKLK
jgi:hypothetical protein